MVHNLTHLTTLRTETEKNDVDNHRCRSAVTTLRTCRQFLSTVEKRLYSVGSCRWMSDESKMGCRYSHERCTLIHSSSTSDTVLSVSAHLPRHTTTHTDDTCYRHWHGKRQPA